MSDNTKTQYEIELEKLVKDRYRFGGERYSLRGTNHWGTDDWIPQQTSLFAFPKSDMQNPEPA